MTRHDTVEDHDVDRDETGRTPRMWRRAFGGVALVFALAIAAGACADDGDDGDDDADATDSSDASASTDATDGTTDGDADDDADEASVNSSESASEDDDSDDSDVDDSASDDGDDSESPQVTLPSSTIVPPTSPAATAPVDEPVVGVETLPPVTVGEAAEVESGLAVRVLEANRIDIDEPRPGEFAGQALAVIVEVENVGDEPVDLIGFGMTAADADGAPLIMNLTDPYEPVGGLLDVGESVSGTYLFMVDDDRSVILRIEDALSPEVIIVEI